MHNTHQAITSGLISSLAGVAFATAFPTPPFFPLPFGGIEVERSRFDFTRTQIWARVKFVEELLIFNLTPFQKLNNH